LQARTYKLLGDAYADLGRIVMRWNIIRKRLIIFEADKTNSAEALFSPLILLTG